MRRSFPETLRSRLPHPVIRRPADITAVLALFLLAVLGAWDLLGNEYVVGADAATQYYPWYSFLGKSLRSGEIPEWNPYQFSGTPFVADPLSGWAYLPAMLLFALLPLTAAAQSFVLFHLSLATLSAYALARSLGQKVPGALLAGVAYGFSGLLYLQSTCCFTYVSVMSWFPLAILGAELAIRSRRLAERLLWWGMSGLALSQVLAAWFGQGSSYVMLAQGGYVAYRTLLDPPNEDSSGARPGLRKRLLASALHGPAVLVFSFGLAAAGLLPRLEYNRLSNLAGGYSSVLGLPGSANGLAMRDWGLLLEPGSAYYAGVAVLALALVAPFFARRRCAVPYFALLSCCALVLSLGVTTPLHTALYLLPLFEQLHPYGPGRVLVVFYLGAALMAGATLDALGERAGSKPLLLVAPVLAVLLLAAASATSSLAEGSGGTAEAGIWEALRYSLSEKGVWVLASPLLALVGIAALVPAYALVAARLAASRTLALRGITAALLTLVVFVELIGGARISFDLPHDEAIGMNELAAYYRPSGAAGFLQARSKEEQPFRYFGYASQYEKEPGPSGPAAFAEPLTRALEIDNRALSAGLQSIQGYDPTHIARYDEFARAINGFRQNYHHLDFFEQAFDSPLLDLLNTRYVVVSADTPSEDQTNLQRVLCARYPTVYEDGQTKVLENKSALPRVWLVHSTRQVATKEEALDLLSTGQIDPKETALLEDTPPPEVYQPDDASADEASVTEYGANDIKLKTSTSAPGLLVLSEVYYPAWKAYMDGQPVSVHVADYLLRSVAVPAGEHTLELRYESQTLRTGIAISLVTYAALIALAVVAVAQRRRKRRRGRSCHQRAVRRRIGSIA